MGRRVRSVKRVDPPLSFARDPFVAQRRGILSAEVQGEYSRGNRPARQVCVFGRGRRQYRSATGWHAQLACSSETSRCRRFSFIFGWFGIFSRSPHVIDSFQPFWTKTFEFLSKLVA